MFTRKDYLSNIINKADSEFDIAYLLLSARGFLIEKEDNMLVLSDNSHKNDSTFLNEILKHYRVGTCEEFTIKINNTNNVKKLQYLFPEMHAQITFPVVAVEKDWMIFKNNIYGPKVEVKDLEPYIARYVKALTACGLSTCLSCDGNHPGINSLFIYFNGSPFELWHGWILKRILNATDLNLSKGFTTVNFDNKNRYDIYYKLLCYANHLYNHRIALRELKIESSKVINKTTIKKLTGEEIFNLVAENADNILKNYKGLIYHDV